MRTTTLERIEGRRLVPYDCDNHDLLDKQGRFDFGIEDVRQGSLTVRLTFKVEFRRKIDGQLWGLVEGEATTKIDSDMIETPEEDHGEFVLSQNVSKLVEGAVSEDLFLAVSQVARSMHLPSLLVSPVRIDEMIFHRAAREPAPTGADLTAD